MGLEGIIVVYITYVHDMRTIRYIIETRTVQVRCDLLVPSRHDGFLSC